MPEINYQFYTFNEDHYAVPIDFSIPQKKQSWHTVVAYIEQLLGYPPISQPQAAGQDACILVLLADTRDLLEEQTYQHLTIALDDSKKPVRHIKKRGKEPHLTGLENPLKFDEEQLRQARPILLVAAEDIMDLFGEPPGEDIKKSDWRYQYRLNLDARVKFWDAGIWHQYVPIDGHADSTEEHFGTRFQKTFDKMAQWYEQGLYSTFVALENLEFQTRLMQQSFIADIGHHGHETRVTPFKFHSEAVMARMSEEIIQELTSKLIQNFKWRLLLIDDFSDIPISSLDKKCNISKSALIHQILHEGLHAENIFEIAPPKDKNQTVVDADIIDCSFGMMEQNTYDILLLDYLLGSGKMERTGREYGYDFLRELIHRMASESNIHKGPLGRFWIFPISSFPFAFADKLRQLGMDGFSDHWHLSGGGDPICTPELFRYNFLNFIKQQISECYLHPNALKGFFNRFSNISNGILWRNLVLNAVESIHLNKSVLENDETHGSLFARTMLSFIRNNRHYKTSLDQIRSFVANIMEIPYFRIEDALGTNTRNDAEKDEDKIKADALKRKSALFFRAEKKLEEKIDEKNTKNDGDTFDFDNERLRWLPAAIGKLKNTRVLRLGNNQLSTLPIELTQLSNLQQLDLSYNQLEALPNDFKELKALEYLDLTGNASLPEYLRTKHEGKDEIQELFDNTAIWNRERRKKVVVSYASQDSKELVELEKILKPLQRSGAISFWADNRIFPGQQWDPEIQQHFQQADIILLLISVSFLASDYIYNVEMNIALERHRKKECEIIPIILKACDWQHEPLKKFQALPKSILPVYSSYRTSPDEAWKEVSEGIRKVITYGRLP